MRKPSPAKQARADRLHLRDCAVRNPSTAFGALVPTVSLCLQCRDIERRQREQVAHLAGHGGNI